MTCQTTGSCFGANLGPMLPAILLACVTIGAGCSGETPQPDGDNRAAGAKPAVVQSFSDPVFAICRQAAGDQGTMFDAQCLVPETESGLSWKPLPEQLLRIQQADLILLSGAGFDQWSKTATLPRSRTVDTAREYYDLLIRVPDLMVHRHGPEGDHTHPGSVWATWLDPALLKTQATTIQASLSELDDVRAETVAANLTPFMNQCDRLSERIDALAEMHPDVTILADGPWFLYLTKNRLQWKTTYLHWPAGGNGLDAVHWKELEDADRAEARLFLTSSAAADSQPDRFAALGIQAVYIDLCIQHDPNITTQSLLARLESNINRLEESLLPVSEQN